MRNLTTKTSVNDVKAFLHGADQGTITINGTKKKITILGAGVEAVVFKMDSDPIEVIKVMANHLSNLSDNPYLRYINYSRRYATANPYLPRVASMTKQVVKPDVWADLKMQIAGDDHDPYYKHPKSIITFRMEKLQPLKKLDTDQIDAISRKSFGTWEEYDPRVDGSHAQFLKGIINAVYDKKTKYGRHDLDPDQKLVEVLKAVSLIQKKTGSDYDIHGNNVMFRFATGGPQLVITDPLNTEFPL